MEEAKVGKACKLYKNTGTPASPTWVLIDQIGDVMISGRERGMAELKRRADDNIRGIPLFKGMFTCEFSHIHGPDKTIHDALFADFEAGTAREYAALDALITTEGAEGMRFPACVTMFDPKQPLEDVAGADVRLTFAYMLSSGSEVDPSWHETAGS